MKKETLDGGPNIELYLVHVANGIEKLTTYTCFSYIKQKKVDSKHDRIFSQMWM